MNYKVLNDFIPVSDFSSKDFPNKYNIAIGHNPPLPANPHLMPPGRMNAYFHALSNLFRSHTAQEQSQPFVLFLRKPRTVAQTELPGDG